MTGVGVLFNGVGHAVGEDDGFFDADDFEEADELLGADEGAGAVVDEDVLDVGGEGFEGVYDGVLAFFATANEDARSRRVSGKFGELALVAADDDVEIGDTACEERGDGVGEAVRPDEGGGCASAAGGFVAASAIQRAQRGPAGAHAGVPRAACAQGRGTGEIHLGD